MKRASILLLVILTLATTSGCSRLLARRHLKKGNQHYRQTRYEMAIQEYGKIKMSVPERVEGALNTAYSFQAQYRFGSTSDVDKAIAMDTIHAYDEYLRLLEKRGDVPKADWPGREDVEETIITLLIDSARTDDAIQRLEAKLETASDSNHKARYLRGLASAYDKKKKPAISLGYNEKWAALADPGNADPAAVIAALCWNFSYRLAGTLDPKLRNRWIDTGLVYAEKALSIDPISIEGLTYKNLLLRERAKLRLDPDEVNTFVMQANLLRDKAQELLKKKKEGAAAAAAKASGGSTNAETTPKAGT